MHAEEARRYVITIYTMLQRSECYAYIHTYIHAYNLACGIYIQAIQAQRTTLGNENIYKINVCHVHVENSIRSCVATAGQC
jgi:hypothetical protein